MPKFIVVYRTIVTEIWEVEAAHSEAAKTGLAEKGYMICPPLYEDQLEIQRAGRFVFPEGKFPSFQEIK
ncbi:hypothetical protein QBK99_25155 [Corticibacterium sp. UT-5YL-CI-8]|nr:hypothetical protein [Tianweitania sp. UT-5YL-CI-8]